MSDTKQIADEMWATLESLGVEADAYDGTGMVCASLVADDMKKFEEEDYILYISGLDGEALNRIESRKSLYDSLGMQGFKQYSRQDTATVNRPIIKTGIKKEKHMLKLLKFSATWCGPCKRLAPIYASVKQTTPIKDVLFEEIDVDVDPVTPAQYKVMSIPTMVLLKDGVEVGRLVGLVKEEDIRKMIDGNK